MKDSDFLYEGVYDEAKKRYLGSIKLRALNKEVGKFWIEIVETNFWLDTAITGGQSSSRSWTSENTRERITNTKRNSISNY